MSGTLPTWMERWFGLPVRPGMGTAWRLEGRWPLPAWATLLLAAVLLAAVIHVYLRENRKTSRRFRLALAAIRLCLVGLVLAMAAQVGLLLQRTGLPFVVVIIDDTRSMNTVDQYDAAVRKALEARVAQTLSSAAPLTRWNLARTLFAETNGAMLAALSEDHKLRFCFLSDLRESRAGDVPGILAELKSAEAEGESTRLGAALRSALDDLRGTTPAAIVLASDGINTDGPGLMDAAAYARREGVPLFLLGIGSDRPASGLRLSDPEVEETVFVNDLVHFRFKLTGNGYQGKTVRIVMKRDGQAGSGEATSEVVGRADVTVVADGRPQDVVIPYRPTQPGRFGFRIEVEDKTTVEPLTAKIRVSEEKIHVLLVDGAPRYEWRYLYNLLSREPTIQLHTLLQEADPGLADDAETAFIKDFPALRSDLAYKDATPKCLQYYDAVIFGDVDPSLLGPAALQNLADYVDRSDGGGALVVIAGPGFMPKAYVNTPLARLLPFDPATVRQPALNMPLSDTFIVQPTELGRTNPAMQLEDSPEKSLARWQELPPLNWMVEVANLRPAAQVLAENPRTGGVGGKRLPAIILQYVGGGGRVLFHATDETYKWRRDVGDLYFARYWVQMLRFLTRSRLAEDGRSPRLSTDRREYRQGDAVHIRAAFPDGRSAPLTDSGVTIDLARPGRRTEKVQLRRAGQTDSAAQRNRFEAVLQDLAAGSYHARMIVPSVAGNVPAADFIVRPPEIEKINVPIDAADMRQAAALTNGKYYDIQDASRLPDDLPGGRQVPVENLPPFPLWNRWPVLLLFLVLLIAEWLLRKRGGMI